MVENLSWLFQLGALAYILWLVMQPYLQQLHGPGNAWQQAGARPHLPPRSVAGGPAAATAAAAAAAAAPGQGKKARRKAAKQAADAAAGGQGLAGAPGDAVAATDARDGSDAGDEAADAELMREVLQDYMSKAQAYRADLQDKRLTVEHVMLAMAEDHRFGEVMSCAEGSDPDSLKRAIRKSRVVYNRGGADEAPPDTGVLSKYSQDLTLAASEGKLDPVIGRHGEMRRLIDVLGRRTKNSAVLIGEPGVGKTSIIHGLAQRLAAGDVPDGLAGARLVALELGLLMAGATFPGEFEERLRGVLSELTAAGPQAILFIDDIHAITGPNAQQGGGVNDASVMLKPLLARGEVRVVGCTTQDKYRKFIEKDPGLERRFQTVAVEQPGVPETISILRGLRHKYQEHHGVRISDAALAAAASLSDSYLPDRCLPDKAIDLIDEAAAKVKTDLVLKPEALDRAERRIRQLQAERKALQRAADLDKAAAEELAAVDGELTQLKEQVASLYDELEERLAASERTQRLQDDLERLDAEIDAAEEAGDDERAEELRKARRAEIIGKLRTLRRRNAAAASAAAAAAGGKSGNARRSSSGRLWGGKGGGGGGADGKQGGKEGSAAGAAGEEGAGAAAGDVEEKHAMRAEVQEADVARIISAWTGIPLTKLVESEASRLLHLSDELHKRIVGQHEAVGAISEAIQRSRAGMKDPNGPIASFLFLGPTGVGKTELAKALAAQLFNTEQAMVRLDMSEYMEKHAVAKLIGAPPGYVGFDEGGQLTEQVRRRPYCVVLFDEVEKAHVDVFNLLLQILDDGRVTDSQGRVVSFKNAIIILTSNLGSAEIFNAAYATHKAGKGAAATGTATPADDVRELVMARVRKHFQPEFLNRIDEFICFEPLSNEQIAHIVGMRLAGVERRVGDKKMRLDVRPTALEHLAAVGFDPVYGARPVKRAIQRELETPLAQALLRGLFEEFDTIVVEGDAEGLRFFRIPAPAEPDDAPSPRHSDSSSTSGTPRHSSKHAAAQQPQQPPPLSQLGQQMLPVVIPNAMRHVGSSGRMAAGSITGSNAAAARQQQQQQSAAGGGSSGSSGGSSGVAGLAGPGLKKPAKSDALAAPGATKQQQQQQPAPPPAAAVNGAAPNSVPAAAAAAAGAVNGGSGSSGASDRCSSPGLVVGGLDADVAARLAAGGGPLPAFLQTPVRRDGQEDLPTQSW